MGCSTRSTGRTSSGSAAWSSSSAWSGPQAPSSCFRARGVCRLRRCPSSTGCCSGVALRPSWTAQRSLILGRRRSVSGWTAIRPPCGGWPSTTSTCSLSLRPWPGIAWTGLRRRWQRLALAASGATSCAPAPRTAFYPGTPIWRCACSSHRTRRPLSRSRARWRSHDAHPLPRPWPRRRRGRWRGPPAAPLLGMPLRWSRDCRQRHVGEVAPDPSPVAATAVHWENWPAPPFLRLCREAAAVAQFPHAAPQHPLAAGRHHCSGVPWPFRSRWEALLLRLASSPGIR
mmetsp:Transcript_132827/g.283833  ORF Transcript_132827/g.283833 Transcript_132827/m.283833 type:complete len:286 (-) Transcript_132827:107-964(-)